MFQILAPIFDSVSVWGVVVGACPVNVVVVVALFVALVGVVAVVVGLDVDRGHGLGFLVWAYTYL